MEKSISPLVKYTSLRWLSSSAVPEQQEVEEEGVLKEVKKEEKKKVPESNAWQELLDRKLHKLDMDVRRTGRVGLYDLENALSNVEKGLKCTANQVMKEHILAFSDNSSFRHFCYYDAVVLCWLIYLQMGGQSFSLRRFRLFDRSDIILKQVLYTLFFRLRA